MSYVRSSISDFGLVNTYYALATVTVYEANAYGERTTVLAPLYEGVTGPNRLANPQTLTALGKFARPVYVDRDVIAVVSGRSVETHETGVITTYAFTDYAVDTFTGTGNQTVFTLSRLCGAASLLDVTIDGARQQPDTAYTVAGTTSLTFTEAPPLNAAIFVVHSATPAPLQPVRVGPTGATGAAGADGGTGVMAIREYTGDGATVTYSLGASSVINAIISINGIVQPPTRYTLAGNTVTFGEAPPLGALVDIRSISAITTLGFQVGDTTAGFFTWSRTGDGATLTFSISGAPLSLPEGYAVAINGVAQEPTAAYSVNVGAGTITFTEAPPSSSRIVITCLGFPRPITEYVAPVSGAISRTVQGRLGETVSVKDFGAVGDGVTNDTAALQAAIDACKGNGTLGLVRHKLYVPVGTYLHTGLTIDRALILVGEHQSSSRLVLIAPATRPAIIIKTAHDGTNYPAVGHPGPEILISDLRIQGSGKSDSAGLAAGADGLSLQEAVTNSVRPHISLERVTIYNCARDAINAIFWDFGALTAHNSWFYNNGQHGLNANSCNDWQFMKCAWGSSTKDNVHLSGCSQFIFVACNIFSATENNIFLFNSTVDKSNNYFYGCSIDRAGRHGVDYDIRVGAPTVFSSCYFSLNSSSSSGTYDDIHVNSSVTTGLRLIGCWFQKSNPQDAARKTKYNIEFAGSAALISLSACDFANGAAYTVGSSNAPKYFTGPDAGGMPAVLRVHKNGTAQTMTTGVAAKLTFGTVHYDTEGMWDAANNRYTPTIAGYYRVTARTTWSSTGGVDQTFHQLIIKRSGFNFTVETQRSSGVNSFVMTAHALMTLDGTGYVEIYAQQNTGGSRDILGDTTETSLEIMRIK
jgi:hypothetical protein